MATRKHRFTVRKMVNGYNGVAKYYAYDLKTKGRVTVHAHLMRDTAQMEADRLNIADMVKPHAEDPRPYEVREAEATDAYYREPGCSCMMEEYGVIKTPSGSCPTHGWQVGEAKR